MKLLELYPETAEPKKIPKHSERNANAAIRLAMRRIVDTRKCGHQVSSQCRENLT